MTEETAATTPRRRGFASRHKVLIVFAVLVLLLVGVVGGWSLYLNAQLQSIPRVDAGITPSGDGGSGSGSGSANEGRGLNILLAGTDTHQPGELARLVRTGWQPGAMRSDTIMVVHLTADRKHAYVISIPRDTWTDVPGYGMQKINAAFSYGGPQLYVQTIEDFTGLHIDHLAVVDWTGFKGLTDALGGVDVTIPRTVADPSAGRVWHQGTVHLNGDLALAYVRQRHGLPNGDFDRIKRQQNFLRAIMAKLLSSGTVQNPVTLTKAVQAIASQLTLDDTFTNSDIRSLALSLRGLRMHDVSFVTLPLKHYAQIHGQDVNVVDRNQVKVLFGAVMTDDLGSYLAQHANSKLPAADQVS